MLVIALSRTFHHWNTKYWNNLSENAWPCTHLAVVLCVRWYLDRSGFLCYFLELLRILMARERMWRVQNFVQNIHNSNPTLAPQCASFAILLQWKKTRLVIENKQKNSRFHEFHLFLFFLFTYTSYRKSTVNLKLNQRSTRIQTNRRKKHG